MPREEITRAEKWLRENLLAQELLKRSHINEKTLKTLLLYSWSEGATFEEIAKRLNIQQPGAWKRWKRGRDAIMRSFYTIELAIYAGVLESETAEVLIDDLLDYVSLSRGEGNVEELRDRIERRMVQLARELPRKK
jgi:DNA-binding CsgD family transcriptional regulator